MVSSSELIHATRQIPQNKSVAALATGSAIATGSIDYLKEKVALPLITPDIYLSSNSTVDTMSLIPEVEYDDLDEQKYSPVVRCAAGAVAGIAEHILLFPMDTIKTNCQTGSEACLKINRTRDAIRYFLTPAAWRGSQTAAPGVAIAHAGQFYATTYFADVWKKQAKQSEASWFHTINPSLLAGFIGALPHDIIMTPTNVIKQRMQRCSTTYPSVSACFAETVSRHGYLSLFRSFPLQFGITGIDRALFFYLYDDKLRRHINPWLYTIGQKYGVNSDSNLLSVTSFLLRSFIAAAVSITITMPMDNIVTRVNTQYKSFPCMQSECRTMSPELKGRLGLPQTIEGVITFKSAYADMKTEGLYKSSFSGYKWRMIYGLPGAVLSWGAFEMTKMFLNSTEMFKL